MSIKKEHKSLWNPTFTDLRKFYHAVVLSEECNFARASARLCITQSALTRSIQSLESILDIKLFDRSHTKVSATPAGAMILEKARSLLLNAGNLSNDAALVRDAEIGNLHFGVSINPASIYLPESLVKLHLERPHLKIFVERRNNDELKKLLLKEKIEFYIGHQYHEELVNPNLTEEQLAKIPVHFFCREGHPLLHQKSVNFDDIQSYPIAQTQNSISTRASYHMTDFDNEGTSGTRQGLLVMNDIHTLKAIAINTNTILVCSKTAVENDLNDGSLKTLTLSDPRSRPPLTCSIIKIRGRTLSPAANLVIDNIQQLIHQKMEP